MKNELLRVEHIGKTFLETKILNNVFFDVFKNEIFGIIGLIDSGKTVLVNILAGVYTADTGVIYLDDTEIHITSQIDARKHGIYCINEKSKLIPNLSIAENVFVIRENNRKKYIKNKKHIRTPTDFLFKKFGLNIDPNLVIEKLSLLQRHLVEIIKAVSLNAKLIILDNITEKYSEKELLLFKQIILRIRESGISFILATNKLDCLLEITDRMMIIREGTTVGLLGNNEYDKEKLLKLLAGHNLANKELGKRPLKGKEILKVERLSNVNGVKDISFSLYSSEVLGIHELSNGGIELAYSLFGTHFSVGRIFIDNKELKINNIHASIHAGMALIPEDIISTGLFYNLNLIDNINILMLKKYHKWGKSKKRLKCYTANIIKEKMHIERKNSFKDWQLSSRTEQMKIVLSKWLATNPKIIIFINPFMSTDEVTKHNINRIINHLSNLGISIIIISSNYINLTKICDRILVMEEGRITKEKSFS